MWRIVLDGETVGEARRWVDARRTADARWPGRALELALDGMGPVLARDAAGVWGFLDAGDVDPAGLADDPDAGENAGARRYAWQDRADLA